VRVDTNPSHVVNSFDPDSALGSSIDVLSQRDIDLVYSPHILEESLSAGWGPITYRNNTELRMAAWHWNTAGTWSDEKSRSGYFTGRAELGDPIRYIAAYSLPHRGFATSGDRPYTAAATTYWKSNPYLTSKFTGESDALHPQWVVVDLQAEQPVERVRSGWTTPYAKSYRVEYWKGNNALDFDEGPEGDWITLPDGVFTDAKGGDAEIKTNSQSVRTRFIRVWMTESSNTCDLHGPSDIRNCVGYAIRSIEVSAAGQVQSRASYTASSIDPWHAASDTRNDGSYQHSGFDLFFTSGLTNNLPAMIPVTMLYGTPDDAAAQIAYLEKRGYPIGYVEMGEEPDGKHALPEDYGALYLQWATALHKIDSSLKLGGPVFEGVNEDIRVWPDKQGRTSWMGRFVSYLKEHGRLSDLAFVSFEHYPFEACKISWQTLYTEPQLIKHILQVWRDDGVPPNVPLMVTENHLAPALAGPMSTIFGGLWLADTIGSFFEAGGAAFYHSPIQPQTTNSTCSGWASWSNFESDRDYHISGYMATYFAAHMINLEWSAHRSGVHRMFPSTISGDAVVSKDVTSYTVLRPDGNWSIMLVNRSQTDPHEVKVSFDGLSGSRSFSGPVRFVTFGSEQYVWHDDGPNSHADPDNPPAAKTIIANTRTTFTLPKASITVLRGSGLSGSPAE
jgi:hypothetical protein